MNAVRSASRSRTLLELTRKLNLRKGRAIAGLLLAFVAAGTLLFASATGLVTTLMTSVPQFMEQAQTPHYLQMHAGDVDRERLEAFVASQPEVVAFRDVKMLNIDGDRIRVGDETLARALQDNGFVVQNPDFDFLLDESGGVIEPLPGGVHMPLYYRDLFELETGDVVTIETDDGDEFSLTIAGFLRDSQMNASMASSKRLLIHDSDWTALAAQAGQIEHLIEFRFTDPTHAAAFETAYTDAGLEANGPTITWTMFQFINLLSEGILAVVLILASALIVALTLLCLQMTLIATVEEEYRDIGIMKAVGVRPRDIRGIFQTKYRLNAGAGALLGLVLTPVLSGFLSSGVRTYMGSASSAALGATTGAIAVASAVLVFLTVDIFVRISLRRLETVSVASAIRGVGAPQEVRRRAPGSMRLPSGEGAVVSHLAWRSITARRGLHAMLLTLFILVALLVTIPQNLTSTITAKEFMRYMGVGVSDIRIDLQALEEVDAKAAEVGSALESDSRIERFTASRESSVRVVQGEKSAPLKVEFGDHVSFPVAYTEGGAPTVPGVIALSILKAEELGVGMGDVLTIDSDGAVQDVTVGGLYQEVTNGGRTAKMAGTGTERAHRHIFAITVYRGADPHAVVADITAEFPWAKVAVVEDYTEMALGGIIGSLRTAVWITLALGVFLSALLVGLALRILLAKDDHDIAVQKAIGMPARVVAGQYTVSLTGVLLAGLFIGSIVSLCLGQPIITLMLSSFGVTRIDFIIDPLTVFVLTPLALVAAALLTGWIGAHRGVSAVDTALVKE